MLTIIDAVLDELQTRRGTLALYEIAQEHPILQEADVAAELANRISQCAGQGDREAAEWLDLIVAPFLKDIREHGLREAVKHHFSRTELAIPEQLMKIFSTFGSAMLEPDRGISILHPLPPQVLSLFGEMFERQVVGLQVDGDLIFHRTFQERLECLRAYESGSPPPARQESAPEPTVPVDDQSAIYRLYKRTQELVKRFVGQGDAAALDEASSAIAETMNHPEWDAAAPALKDSIMEGHATLLASRYQIYGRDEDAEAAIAIWTELAERSADANLVAGVLANCAVVLEWQARRSGRSEVLDNSIKTLQRLSDQTHSAIAKVNLASLTLKRFETQGDMTDLEIALIAASDGIAYSELGDRSLPPALITLSKIYQHRYFQSRHPEHLRLAQRYIDDAILLLEGHSFDQAQLVGALIARGAILTEIFESGQDTAALDEAIASLETALAAISPADLARVQTTINLAEALESTPEDHPQARDRIERAIDLLRNLSADLRFGPSDRLLASNALAGSLLEHWRMTGAKASRAEAFGRWEANSGAEAAKRFLPLALAAARNRGQFALAEGDWPSAADAFAKAVTYVEQIVVMRNLVGRHRRVSIRQTFGVAGLGAYALARAGRAAEAIITLERGRAFNLSYALNLGDEEMRRLGEAGRADLVSALQLTAESLWGTPDDSEDAPEISRPIERFSELLDEVRGVPGFEDFLASITDDLLLTSADKPIVYLLATAFGGMALLLEPSHNVDIILLPDFTEARLAEHVKPLYLDGESQPAEQFASTAKMQQLDDALGWLWPACIGPVVERLAGHDEIIVIPTGYLALLPLQAAWRPDAERSTGREYAVDRAAMIFAPNLRAVQACRSRTQLTYGGAPLLVGDPLPSAARRLKAARTELREIAATLAESQLLEGAAATATAILGALRDRHLFHFAGHACSDQDEPLESFLLAARDEHVTARSILRNAPNGIRLAVLSACQTAMPGMHNVDEVVSLGVLFIQAGAAGVVASMWPVADAPTMILMTEFYRRWQDGAVSPQHALAAAQKWMCTSSAEAKRDSYSELLRAANIRTPESAWERYRHPFYWAAFTYTGA